MKEIKKTSAVITAAAEPQGVSLKMDGRRWLFPTPAELTVGSLITNSPVALCYIRDGIQHNSTPSCVIFLYSYTAQYCWIPVQWGVPSDSFSNQNPLFEPLAWGSI